ncbi:hypothetical protein [Thiomicrorhabdus sp.]|uniref:hypothetical protein n=1 Tax=Thiomicrorhabdus sp. TaxID=2039724 RepID=UPI002AA8B57D|nr:hypothetical protein [Thiomicrorhabdus sp.]
MIKTIFITISTTLIVATFVVSTFLNGILGLFGLASTSTKTLNELRNSKQVVENMKKRHAEKKLAVSKKYVKRSSQKIASSAVAAATIGTAGVVVTIAGLEVYEYCEDKKELQEDENILFNKKEEFNFNECLIAANEDSKEIVTSVKKAVPEIVDQAWEDTKGFSSETWETTKAMSASVWSNSLDTLDGLWKKFTDWIN